MDIISLFASSNYLVVNKELIKALGLEETIFLSELASEQQWYLKNKSDETNDNNGYFYSTIENIEERTTLKRKVQDRCLKKLKELGIIEIKNIGLPCKRHFKINPHKLVELLSSVSSKDSTVCSLGTNKIGQQGQQRIIIKNNNKINNKENKKFDNYSKSNRITIDELDTMIELNERYS